VAGYRKWQELGRQVRKGEKGIAILVPHKRRLRRDQDESEERRENEPQQSITTVASFGVSWVYDHAQTDGTPLAQPPAVETVDGASDTGMRLYVDLLDYLDVHGVTAAH